MKLCMVVFLSVFCASRLFATNMVSVTTTVDFRAYALEVLSDHGSPVPSVGTHSNYCWQSSVMCSVEAAVVEGGTIYSCSGWSGTGSVPVAGATTNTGTIVLSNLNSSIAWDWNTDQGSSTSVVSVTTTVDFRDYTLEVASDHGSPVPSIGTHSNYCWQSSVMCSVASVVGEGGTIYSCSGWSGTGSIPVIGATTNTGTIVLSNLNSSIAWNWNTDQGSSTSVVSVTTTVDFRDYTLEVASNHGSPVPSIGTHSNYCWQSSVMCSVESVVVDGGTIYSCSGWSGTGSVPVIGVTTNTGTIVLSNLNSSTAWNWGTNYWLEAVTVGNGSVTGGSVWVAAQSNVTLSVTPDAGWLFMGWSGDLVEDYSHTNVTVQMDAPKNLTASFSEDADGDGLLNSNETAVGSNPRMVDTDGDGFDDKVEVDHGASPIVDDSWRTDYILENKDTFGHYTQTEVGALVVGDVTLEVSDGVVELGLQLEKSDDLIIWTNIGEAVEWSVPAGAGKAFYRVRGRK